MGINYSCKTKAKDSLRLYNLIGTFLFEQEFEELLGNPKAKEALVQARKELSEIIKKQK